MLGGSDSWVGRRVYSWMIPRITSRRRGRLGLSVDVLLIPLASSDAQAARSEAQAEQDELIAVIAELIERARRAGTIRPGTEAIDIAMLICGVVSAMGPRPGFDWPRPLDLVTDTLRVR